MCNELYPISVAEDIAQNQPEWSSDNYIERLKEKAYDEAYVQLSQKSCEKSHTYTLFGEPK